MSFSWNKTKIVYWEMVVHINFTIQVKCILKYLAFLWHPKSVKFQRKDYFLRTDISQKIKIVNVKNANTFVGFTLWAKIDRERRVIPLNNCWCILHNCVKNNSKIKTLNKRNGKNSFDLFSFYCLDACKSLNNIFIAINNKY